MPRKSLSAVQPDGTPHWVDLRELRVSRGDRKRVLTHGKKVMAAIRAANGDVSQVDDDALEAGGFDFLDAIIFYWVVGWSLTWEQTVDAPPEKHAEPLPVPKDDPDVLDVLEIGIGTEIEEALTPVMNLMSGRKVSVDDVKDPDSPSVPSAA